MTSSVVGPEPAVPTSGAYLGAFVDPKGTGGNITQICPFEQQTNRSLALDNHFLKWTDPMPGTAADYDISNDTIPMLSWNCNASIANDAQILDHDDDSWITQEATAVAHFGQPVFIRWFWEMDLAGTNAKPCLAGMGAPGYVAAFQYIVNMFRANGATNAAFVWCPSSFGFLAKPAGNDNAMAYYPGSAYVSWIAEDVYDNPDTSANASPLSAVQPFYSAASGQDKPLMIAETAAVGSDQPSWIRGFGAKQFRSTFPDVHAVSYYDAPNDTAHHNWQLTSRGTAAFARLGQTSYFSPTG